MGVHWTGGAYQSNIATRSKEPLTSEYLKYETIAPGQLLNSFGEWAKCFIEAFNGAKSVRGANMNLASENLNLLDLRTESILYYNS